MRRQRSGFRFSILAQGREWTEYASGQVARNQRPLPPRQKVDQIRARCSRCRLDFDENRRTLQEHYFDFGPRWRNLRTLHIGELEALGELELRQDFFGDLQTWPVHPALLDLATGASLYLIRGYEEGAPMYLPLSYKRIALYRPAPARFFSHITSRQGNTMHREIATFDLALLDTDGQVWAEIDEFSLRRMAANTDGPNSVLRTGPAALSRGMSGPQVARGLSSTEGIRALDEILSSEVPPAVIVARGQFAAGPANPSAAKSSVQSSVNPKGGLEGTLAEWWQEMLGVDKVGPDDDFFDLGGHSLVAVRLFSKIKRTFLVDMGLSTLFEARTVRQLAAAIRQAGAARGGEGEGNAAIVAIRENGSRLPLFLLSGLGGEVIGFHALARYLGDDQPIFALQPQGLDGKQPFLTRVEDMAAYYIRGVRRVRPQGPYCLAGYSFGGHVVFEMAQQLHAAGEAVAMLGMLDTIEWQYHERIGRTGTLRQRWALRIDRIRRRRWNYVREAIELRATRVVFAAFRKLGRPLPQRLSTLQDSNRFAMSLYRPAVYPGRLVIFRSVTRGDAPDNDELLGWGELAAQGIEVQDVTGSHRDMLVEPNVRVLAEKLRASLDAVQVPQTR